MNTFGPDNIMFIDPSWQNALVSLLIAINGALGSADKTAVLRQLSHSDVIVIAQALEQRSYRPEQWFGITGATPASRQPLSSVAPLTRPGQLYAVVLFGAEPSERTQVSRRSGGLLFEDPFYAVLAAFNSGNGSLAMEVKASTREQVWARRQEIIDAIRMGTYRADQYFTERGPLLSGRTYGDWRSNHLSGDEIDRLVFNGRAAVSFDGKPSMLYGMYWYVAP
jgi:hypothetical protein